MKIDRDIILQKGWKQGALLPPSCFSKMHKSHPAIHISENCVAIVTSHSCAIASPSLDKEPIVEAIIAKPVDKINNAFIKAKNPRTLDILIDIDKKEQAFRVIIHDKVSLCRTELLNHTPHLLCPILQDESIDQLKYWLAHRYVRITLPDSFNTMIKSLEDKVKKKLVKIHDYVEKIYIALDTYEESLHYTPTFALVADPEIRSKEEHQHLEELVFLLEEGLHKIKGIKEPNVLITYEDQATLEDMKYFQEWNLFDYLSISTE